MKKIILTTLVITIAFVAGTLVNNAARADEGVEPCKGPKGGRLEHLSEFLGIEVEDLRSELEGKTVPELLEEKGISKEDLFEAKKEKVIEHMTERGLSEEEIQERIDRMDGRFRKGRMKH